MSSNNPANSSDPQGQTPNDQNPPGQAPNSNGQAPNETSNVSTEDLLRQIKELRSENASHRKKTQEQATAAQAAEQQRLKEQGEYKQLAETHEARVKQLEPVETSYKALSERVNAQIDTQIKDWPAEVKSLVPSSETPVEQRLEQLERLRPLVDKLQLQAKGTQRGNSPNPPATGQVGDPATHEENVKKLRRSGMYGF